MTPFYDLWWLFVVVCSIRIVFDIVVYHMASIHQLCWRSIGCQDLDQWKASRGVAFYFKDVACQDMVGMTTPSSHHRQGKHQLSDSCGHPGPSYARYSFEMHAPLSAEDQSVSAAALVSGTWKGNAGQRQGPSRIVLQMYCGTGWSWMILIYVDGFGHILSTSSWAERLPR